MGRPPPQARAGGRRDDRGDAGRGAAGRRRRQAGLGRAGEGGARGALPAARQRRRSRRCGWRGSSIAPGPEIDIVRAGEPLLDALLAAGRIRPDPLRIGIDVDADAGRSAPTAAPSDTLSAIGPVTRGTFWESVAVPDIRVQAERVAERLTARLVIPSESWNLASAESPESTESQPSLE